jgi:hypothetical protein
MPIFCPATNTRAAYWILPPTLQGLAGFVATVVLSHCSRQFPFVQTRIIIRQVKGLSLQARRRAQSRNHHQSGAIVDPRGTGDEDGQSNHRKPTAIMMTQKGADHLRTSICVFTDQYKNNDETKQTLNPNVVDALDDTTKA